jgi:hypothetical protein
MRIALRFNYDPVDPLPPIVRNVGAFLHPCANLRGQFGMDALLCCAGVEE